MLFPETGIDDQTDKIHQASDCGNARWFCHFQTMKALCVCNIPGIAKEPVQPKQNPLPHSRFSRADLRLLFNPADCFRTVPLVRYKLFWQFTMRMAALLTFQYPQAELLHLFRFALYLPLAGAVNKKAPTTKRARNNLRPRNVANVVLAASGKL